MVSPLSAASFRLLIFCALSRAAPTCFCLAPFRLLKNCSLALKDRRTKARECISETDTLLRCTFGGPYNLISSCRPFSHPLTRKVHVGFPGHVICATTFETLDTHEKTSARAATMIDNFVWNTDRLTTGRYACTGRFRSIRACIIEEAQFSAHRHVQSVAKGNRALPDCRGWSNLKVEEKRCMFDNYGLLKIFNDNFVKFSRYCFSSKILYKQTKKRRRNVYIALLYIEN